MSFNSFIIGIIMTKEEDDDNDNGPPSQVIQEHHHDTANNEQPSTNVKSRNIDVGSNWINTTLGEEKEEEHKNNNAVIPIVTRTKPVVESKQFNYRENKKMRLRLKGLDTQDLNVIKNVVLPAFDKLNLYHLYHIYLS